MARRSGSSDQPVIGWLYRPLAILAKLLLGLLFGLQIHMDPAHRRLPGPLILIGNHPSYLDPLIMAAAFYPRRIRFLTSSEFFRAPLAARLLDHLGAIPKTQFRSDSRALRGMLQAVRAGDLLAIYPEGQRSLDGRLMPLDEAIAKLVRKCQCPVLAARTCGAYLAWPRWSASGPRLGRIEVEVEMLLTADQIRHCDSTQIKDIITAGLDYDDTAWQQQHRRRYFSLAPARGLENICHRCPACARDLAMKSSAGRLTCRFCGYQVRFNAYGQIRPGRNGPASAGTGCNCVWPDVHTWHRWQVACLAAAMHTPAFRLDFCVVLRRPDRPDLAARPGVLSFDGKELEFRSDVTSSPQDVVRLPVYRRIGISADYGVSCELTTDDAVYQFTFACGQAVIMLGDAILALPELDKPAAG